MTCAVCGCTDANACVLENEHGDGMACWWAKPDLCAACSPEALKAAEIGSPWRKVRGPTTPAQRYQIAAKTLADLAGVNVFEVQAVGATKDAVMGAMALVDLERLAGVVEMASRLRGEDLEQIHVGGDARPNVRLTADGFADLQTSAKTKTAKKGGR